MSKVVYLAGPFRGATRYDVRQNILAAESAMLQVAQMGLYPLCPHTMTGNLDGTLTDDYWLACTLDLMRRCDAVYIYGSWSNSEGTLGEIAEAGRLDIPVFYDPSDLLRWYVEGTRNDG